MILNLIGGPLCGTELHSPRHYKAVQIEIPENWNGNCGPSGFQIKSFYALSTFKKAAVYKAYEKYKPEESNKLRFYFQKMKCNVDSNQRRSK